jgi:hypothetical protein
MRDFTKLAVFLHWQDGKKGPVVITKADGPSKGEPIFFMYAWDFDLAEEIVAKFNGD